MLMGRKSNTKKRCERTRMPRPNPTGDIWEQEFQKKGHLGFYLQKLEAAVSGGAPRTQERLGAVRLRRRSDSFYHHRD